jgi:hypothetical protein
MYCLCMSRFTAKPAVLDTPNFRRTNFKNGLWNLDFQKNKSKFSVIVFSCEILYRVSEICEADPRVIKRGLLEQF